MQRLNVGILPVCDGDILLGVVTDRDIAVRAVATGREPASTTVQQVMTQELVYCYDDQEVGVATRLMQDKQLRRLVVVNRDKQLAGIVSLGDLAIETANEQLTGRSWNGSPHRSTPRANMIAPSETERICRGSGLAGSQLSGNAGEGCPKGGEVYCCRECAERSGCMCQEAGPA